MKIIRATLDQLEQTHALLNEYFEAIDVVVRDTREGVKAFLGEPDHALWLAYVGDDVAGCVALRPLPQIEGAAECKRLYVRPGHRGLGIAEALLDAMEAHAAAGARRWVYLDSKAGLDAAIHLYKKRGYTACGRYNDNPEAIIFLRKAITT
ncbi:GNAT family N-acetyltransferase [Massilia endophytica]|uniref:GNAT family N-acetyltransferase n=1 Tax=Massilia endophytica TaxID=2899220 RepID=UPI001E4F844B|nr:GNAT family N-acetyltransferase [Massilia endophytica]UGQ45915.1 GNAT family N-acetyltransferase [Massilia endophytica]